MNPDLLVLLAVGGAFALGAWGARGAYLVGHITTAPQVQDCREWVARIEQQIGDGLIVRHNDGRPAWITPRRFTVGSLPDTVAAGR